MPNLLTIVLAHAEAPAPLIFPIWVFPLIAAVFFIALAVIVFSYRDVANRHSDKIAARGDADHDAHGAGH